MGIYLNPGDEPFWQAVHSKIYVDKTGLLNYTNKVLRTSQKYLCVSRPRRFGKSMAANMVAAYYDRTVDANSTFAGLFRDIPKQVRCHPAQHAELPQPYP